MRRSQVSGKSESSGIMTTTSSKPDANLWMLFRQYESHPKSFGKLLIKMEHVTPEFLVVNFQSAFGIQALPSPLVEYRFSHASLTITKLAFNSILLFFLGEKM